MRLRILRRATHRARPEPLDRRTLVGVDRLHVQVLADELVVVLGVRDRRLEQLAPVARDRTRRVSEDSSRLLDALSADVVAHQPRLARRRAHVLRLGAHDRRRQRRIALRRGAGASARASAPPRPRRPRRARRRRRAAWPPRSASASCSSASSSSESSSGRSDSPSASSSASSSTSVGLLGLMSSAVGSTSSASGAEVASGSEALARRGLRLARRSP